jgi:hypothetical protein
MGIEGLLIRVIALLNEALTLLVGSKANGIRFLVDGKENSMANVQLTVGFKVPYLVQEVDTTKNPPVVVPAVATDVTTVVSSAPASVSVVPDATVAPGAAASGFLVSGTPLVGVVVTATTTHADGTALGTPKTQTIDVVAAVEIANDISFTLGVPVSV